MRPPLAASALAALGAGWLWLRFAAEPPARGNVFPHDLLYYFHPLLDEMGRRFASGELPLWTLHGCGGRPVLAAMQPAALYPLHWLSAFVPPSGVLAVSSFAHALLGGAGAALVLRRLGTPTAWAAALGVVFVHACVLGESFWPPEAAALAWWPTVLLCADRALEEPRIGWGSIGLALATALQILAGFPQVTFYGAVAVLCWVVGRSAARARSAGGAAAARSLARVVALALLGVGLAGAQLGASTELLADSARSDPFSADEAHYLQHEARAGAIAARAIDPGTVPRSFELPTAAPGYLGVATAVLALVGLGMRRREPLPWVLALFAVASLLLADGYRGVAAPVYEAIASLPGLGHFRAPERLLFLAFAAWIGLAGLGAAAWARAAASEDPADERERRALGVALLLAAAAVWTLGPPGVAVRALGVALLGAAPLLLPARAGWSRGLRRAAVPLAAVLAVVDLAAATGPAGSFRSLPADWARTPHADGLALLGDADLARVAEARTDRVELVAGRGAPMIRPLGTPLPGGRERLACYETLLPAAWPRLSELAKTRDFPSAQGSNLSPERFRSVHAAASVGLVGELRVRDRARLRATRAERAGAFRAGEGVHPGPPAGTELRWHAIDALPRAYRVTRYRVEERLDAALAHLLRRDFDPHREVVVDRAPAGTPSSGAIARHLPAEILERAPERVRVRTRGATPALLVLTDSHAPGWRATVDGAPAEVLRANGLFRAVAVGPGEHEVRFDYAPKGLRFGGLVALTSAVALAGWAGASRRRAPGRGRASPGGAP